MKMQLSAEVLMPAHRYDLQLRRRKRVGFSQ